MTDSQRKVLRVIESHAFNGPEARPSLDLIAQQACMSRRQIQRLLRDLRDQGVVTWRQERRAGCKWRHNVYELKHWSPPLRKRTLRSIARCKAAKPAEIG